MHTYMYINTSGHVKWIIVLFYLQRLSNDYGIINCTPFTSCHSVKGMWLVLPFPLWHFNGHPKLYTLKAFWGQPGSVNWHCTYRVDGRGLADKITVPLKVIHGPARFHRQSVNTTVMLLGLVELFYVFFHI